MDKPSFKICNTPARFTEAREYLGLGKAGLARVMRLGNEGGRKTIRRIEEGQDVPGPYQLAMEALLTGWRPRGVRLPIDERND